MPEKKEVPEVKEVKETTWAERHAAAVAKEEAYLAEEVFIQLPKDNEQYKDDVPVCINGRITVIQRGIQVEVPRSIADQLRASSHQMMVAEAKAAKVKDVRYDAD